MKIIKRDGREQEVSFDKIIDRIKYSSEKLSDIIEPVEIAQKVISYVKDGIHTKEIDEVTAKICMDMSIQHPDFQELASNIIISNHHKNTITGFSDKISILYKNRDHDGKPHPLVSRKLYRTTMKYKTQIDKMMDYERDFLFDYFGYKTLEKSYLLRLQGGDSYEIVERPQDMFMRVSLALHDDDLEQVQKSYDLLSQKYFTHASPTLFNAGCLRSQYASCFLVAMGDSMEGIYKCISDCANISKWAGGLGIHISDIRSKGSLIRGTNGPSNGIVPMLRVLDATAVFANQGSRRKGAIAVYLEPHHPDIMDFLDLRKNHGKEEQRARNLFTAIWLNDYFIQRVREDKAWSLFCPDECPGLSDVYGEEYKQLYLQYESEGKARKTLKAREVWKAMVVSQIETGTPYMLNKDAVNSCSNQSNIGTVKSSNLCVAGDTLILTDTGYHQIQTLANQYVNIWNGQEFSKSLVKQTGINQKMIKLSFSNGKTISCTPYHKFFSGNRGTIEARELFVGEVLQKYKMPSGEDMCVTVTKIEECESADTYCFNEPKRHAGIFNGIMAGNCAEIVEVSTTEEYSVCTLASLCLPSYVRDGAFDHEKLREVVHQVVTNLNKIIDHNFYPVKETKKSNLRHRPMGVGVQGLADVYLKLRLAYDSPEAMQLNKEIFETIYFAALEKSTELAVQEGVYETYEGSPLSQGIFQFDMWQSRGVEVNLSGRWDWDSLREKIKRDGVRNSLLVALMPTASTSQIMGNQESFEPYTSNVYTRKTLAGNFTVINKFLIRDLIELGVWNHGLRQELIRNSGSVQSLDIPEEMKQRYKTIWEIKQKTLIDQSADRGPFVCQSQSLNLYFENPEFRKIHNALLYAHKRNLKTMSYYVRTRAASDAIQFTVEQKSNKEEPVIEEIDDDEVCVSCSG